MAEYKRFVSYLYVYESYVKAANVGFVRVETKGGQCQIYIHMKDICQIPENDHQVYLLRRHKGFLEGIYLGGVVRTGHQGEFLYRTDASHIENTDFSLEDMAGLAVLSRYKKIYGTCWDDDSLDFRTFKKYENRGEKRHDTNKENHEELTDVQTQSVVMTNPLPLAKRKESLSERLDKVIGNGERMYPFEDDEIDACVRLELQDIGMLPMKYWLYASNSFVLRSYYSYRHLILCRKKNKVYFLGVPGMAQNKDKFMAQNFGFSDFKALRSTDEEKCSFGYWYVVLAD